MERNIRIENLKETLRSEVEKNPSRKVVTKSRMMTYCLLVVFAPLGLYRVWTNEIDFITGEKVFLSFITVMYLFELFKLIF